MQKKMMLKIESIFFDVEAIKLIDLDYGYNPPRETPSDATNTVKAIRVIFTAGAETREAYFWDDQGETKVAKMKERLATTLHNMGVDVHDLDDVESTPVLVPKSFKNLDMGERETTP